MIKESNFDEDVSSLDTLCRVLRAVVQSLQAGDARVRGGSQKPEARWARPSVSPRW